MTLAFVLRWLHIIGATMLLGTGAGIAFFMLMAHRTRDARFIAATGEVVVTADFLFTATAVLVQPVTGYGLARILGWPLTTPWLLESLVLYVFTGACWLPVVAIQMRLRDLARDAATRGEPPGAHYERLFRLWFALGIPAFAAVLRILWLMVSRGAA